VLLLTHNEEVNLPRCLNALTWCDDVVAVDSGSQDKSLEIMANFGVRILTRKFDSFADQRNFGLDTGPFKHEWVLHLDADEVITPEFVDALNALKPAHEIDAYHVPAKTMFFGKWLRWAGMWPSYQVRLGHRDRLRFKQVGHGQREDLPPEKLALFSEAYLHFSFSHGLEPWLKKHLRYARDEVEQIISQRAAPNASPTITNGGKVERRRALKVLFANMPLTLRPFLRFYYIYFARLGFLDGSRGFAYAFMLAVYEGMIAVIGFEKLGKLSYLDDQQIQSNPPDKTTGRSP
ncbi:MAG: glycosyltransferase family 2 protein, partial [Pseudomonadota bacterium]